MLLSPSRADCIVFELENVLAEMPPRTDDTEAQPAVKALYCGRWDKLPLPVAVLSSHDRETANAALKTIGWDDLPASRLCLGENALESACRSLGCHWPLVLGASPAAQEMASRLEHADFVAIGHGLSGCIIRFSSAADALRAILGLVS